MRRKYFAILTAIAASVSISAAETAALPLPVRGMDVCTPESPAGDTVRQSLVHAVVTGRVTDSSTGEPVPGANVMLQPPDGRALYGFTTTDGEGRYRFEYGIRADSVRVMITGFNIKKAWKNAALVPAGSVSEGSGKESRSATVDFKAEYEAMMINEVKVTAEPVKRHGDTLSYLVDSYIDTLTDRAIGDVLRKMPGIDVDAAGQIRYNNRPINKFYIEGLDLMGGRYGVAVNNVRAEDISKVEVLENHQPIKALKDVAFSPDAAINLRLKDGAKGSLIATLSLGGGYKPWMWNGELALMLFAGKYQMMTTVKSNNSGDDVSSELTSFYDSFQKEYSPLSVHLPALPDTDRERYMDNLTHAVSVNNIVKLGDSTDADNTLNINAVYLHDRQRYNSSSLTTYYLPGGQPPLEIDETTSATELSDGAEIKLRYNLNNEKIYLNEQIAFGAEWNRNSGSVLSDGTPVEQSMTVSPQLRLQNDLSFVKVLKGNVRLNFSSRINASSLPATLRVTPVLYPEIFGYGQQAREAVQLMDNRKLYTRNTLSFNKGFKSGLGMFVSAGVEADIQGMTSGLTPGEGIAPADSMRNDMYYHKINAILFTGLTYRYRGFHITGGLGLTYSDLLIRDKVQGSDRRLGKLLLNPNVSMSAEITPSLKFNASGAIFNNLGAPSSIYSGYIMTDYRLIGSRNSDIAQGLYQTYSAELSYADALISLFGSVRADYWRSRSNIMYGTEYYGSLSRVGTYNIDNLSQGWGIEGKIEKRFDAISTTVGIPVGFRRTWMDVLRQGEVMPVSTWSLPLGLEVSSRLARSAFMEYYIRYVRSSSSTRDEAFSPINALHQRLGFNFVFFKRLSLNISGEHYLNDAITSGSRNIFFLDASISYRTRRMEYVLEGRNLLNTGTYNQRVWSDITNYQYNYLLRPLSLIFKIKFSIG